MATAVHPSNGRVRLGHEGCPTHGHGYRSSARDAVTLLVYGDDECRHCGAAHAFVEDVRHRPDNDLGFAFRHSPVRAIHSRAERVAVAAEAAGAPGQIWAMHALLFENQHALEDDDLLVYVSEIGFDIGRFAREPASALYAARVREDYLSGLESGAGGQPTLFINNVRHVGAHDAGSLIEAIEHVRPVPAGALPGSGVRTQ
jgi:protein-disulfide isomerase